MTETPATIMSANAVMREAVRTQESHKKVWTTLGPEFGKDASKKQLLEATLPDVLNPWGMNPIKLTQIYG